jgi:hypothetical protein
MNTQDKINNKLRHTPMKSLTIQDFGLDRERFRLLIHMLWTHASTRLPPSEYDSEVWKSIQRQLGGLGYKI